MRPNIKPIMAATLTVAMILSTSAPVFADTGKSAITVKAEYHDVGENAYYYTPVYWAKLNGITVGTSDTTYSPNQPCTRGQMAMFLWRMSGTPEPIGTNYFNDVAPNSDFAKAIAWAKENEITAGTSNTTYSPSKPCTRSQMAMFLWRLNDCPEPNKIDYFTDVAEDSSYAKAIAWAKETGITNGTTATTYTPNRTCTRGEMAVFLWKESGSPTVQIIPGDHSNTIDLKYFSVTVPSDWKDMTEYEERIFDKNDPYYDELFYVATFYYTTGKNTGFGGRLFRLCLYKNNDYTIRPSYKYLGRITGIDGFEYTLVVEFPTDAQFDVSQSNEYMHLYDERMTVINSIRIKDGYTLTR